ncbi:MAG: class I SAM-dependent methyltransferase [Cytophagales bacterium]|nr:MAG: class I SAM-dependent methyltransferase [Cytophagales bacterium]
MTKLYTDLSWLYDAMYQTFIDYDAEFQFYSKLMAEFGLRSVLEIGCGSGHLAKRFTEQGYDYQGVDLSEDMLALARQRCPNAQVSVGDMRTLVLPRSFDAVLITARSISYIVENADVLATFRSLRNCLNPGGKLIFDFIDAASFFGQMNASAILEHRAEYEGQTYLRQSRYVPNLTHGWTWDWHSAFFRQTNAQPEPIADDVATLRAFLPDELRLFLQLAGLATDEIRSQKTYAFDTGVVVAYKNARAQQT